MSSNGNGNGIIEINHNSNNNKNSDHHNVAVAVALEKSESKDTWWKRSLKAALRGGASGSIAMVLQVVLLMWLRTTVNYQYKHGVDTKTAFDKLYSEGGFLRFYRGAPVALLTGPISRFGDTAANEGIRELLGSSKLPVWAITLTASVVASLWRIAITPLDTVKTTLQVSSANDDGWQILGTKIVNFGPGVLWAGALGNSVATLVGHYPWFVVHNFLDARLPKPLAPDPQHERERDSEHKREAHRQTQRLFQRRVLLRRALMGFLSSVASDCVSNGVRVIKTYQQTSPHPITYSQALSELLAANGPAFALRGLGLKILSNGLSGIIFAVCWKMIMELLNRKQQQQKNETKEKEGDANAKPKPKRA